MTLPQRNTALERPTNFYYLMCKLDRAQYPSVSAVFLTFLISNEIFALALLPESLLLTVINLPINFQYILSLFIGLKRVSRKFLNILYDPKSPIQKSN